MVRRMVLLAAAALGVLLGAQPSWAADQWALEQASLSPTGANFPGSAQLQGISANGRHVFFLTSETLVPEDQNGFLDLYDRHDGTTELISIGPSANGYEPPFALPAVSPDGERVIFQTVEDLVPSDNNGNKSLYQRYQGATTLVAEELGSVRGASEDASLVYLDSGAQLVPEDTDTENDLYMWDGNSLSLVTGPGSPIQGWLNEGFSRDGTRIYFTTTAQLDPADNDPSCPDLYVYSNGTASLIGGPVYTTRVCQGTDPRYHAESVEGQHVFFSTTKWLDPVYGQGDGSSFFAYEHFNGQNEPLTRAFGQTDFVAASDAGDRVLLTTTAQLVPEDANTTADLYKRENGQFTLIPGTYQGMSRDGSRVFFLTSAQLLPEDTDTTPDIYVRDGSYTELITSGLVWDSRGWGFVGVSRDGGRAFFSAIYGAPNRCLFSHPVYSNTTTNTGLCAPNSHGPSWKVDKEGTRAAFNTSNSLLPGDTDGAQDVYAANLVAPTGYPRPKGATPTRVPLVPAFGPCTSPNSTHGAPLSFASCKPPAPRSTTAFIGGNDGILPARSIGSVTIKTQVGTAGPPDDADVKLDVKITNVMKPSDGSDYTGELRLELPVRLTDRLNGAPVDPGTVTDTSIFATVPCTPTADATLGSSCALSTTVDSLVPDTVLEGWKAVWALGQIKIHDGGTDGDADTPADNQLLAVQGLFVP